MTNVDRGPRREFDPIRPLARSPPADPLVVILPCGVLPDCLGTFVVMGVTRIVPNLPVTDVARANATYAQILGLDVGMDLGWIGNLSPAEAPAVQLQVMTRDESAPCNPTISVGVAAPAEVDAIHERVVAAGLEVVHPLTDEDWGVHRFFFRDHDDNVVNVVAHN